MPQIANLDHQTKFDHKAETLIGKGLIDAVAFGRDWIANPDLVARLQRKAELNPQRAESFYGGGAEGYTDYPTL